MTNPRGLCFLCLDKYAGRMRSLPRLGLYLSYTLCAGLLYCALVAVLKRRALPVTSACRTLSQPVNESVSQLLPQCDDGTVFGLAAGLLLGTVVGRLAAAVRLPPLLGMLAAGLFLRNVPVFIHSPPPAALINRRAAGALRRAAFALILLQGGLGLDLAALRRLKGVVLRLAAVPCLTETLVVGLTTWLVFGYPITYGLLLGFVLGAVSPAICVPAMVQLRRRHLGVTKGVPTLIIAASSVDDVLAVAGFSALLAAVFQRESEDESEGWKIAWKVLAPVLQLAAGVALGTAAGLVLAVVPPSSVHRLAAWRTTSVLLVCQCCVFGCAALGAGGTGPVACLVAPVVAKYFWTAEEEGAGDVDGTNEAARKKQQETDAGELGAVVETLDILWVLLGEPVLFVLIGCELQLSTIRISDIGGCLLVLACGLSARTLAAFCAVLCAGLNCKERVYIALAWLPKASVQAALAPAFYDAAVDNDAGPYQLNAGVVMMSVAVLGILATAPTGAALMALTANCLLASDEQQDDDGFVSVESPVQLNEAEVEAVPLQRVESR